MGFRDYDIKRILVCTADDPSDLQEQLVNIFKNHAVFDLQYSTTCMNENNSIQYSALLLLGDKP